MNNYFSRLPLLLSLFFSLSIFTPSPIFSEQLTLTESQPILEIDSDSQKVVDQVGGGIYDKKVDSLVPFFPSLVREEWLRDKNEIARRIGPIDPGPTQESVYWRNSASSVDELLLDAKMAAPGFLKMSQEVAKKTGTEMNFGIDNRYMIKSKSGIERKVKESMQKGYSEKEAIGKVRDALRGTLIANNPEQIPLIIDALRDYAHRLGSSVAISNVWEENRSSGYVGVHAKMLFPITDKVGAPTGKNIVVELQIHLRCIMDGTINSVKEREHLLYDLMREHGVDLKVQTAASTLLFLTAMEDCLKETHSCANYRSS